VDQLRRGCPTLRAVFGGWVRILSRTPAFDLSSYFGTDVQNRIQRNTITERRLPNCRARWNLISNLQPPSRFSWPHEEIKAGSLIQLISPLRESTTPSARRTPSLPDLYLSCMSPIFRPAAARLVNTSDIARILENILAWMVLPVGRVVQARKE